MFDDNNNEALTFEEAIEVPRDNYIEISNDADKLNHEITALSNDDDLIIRFHQFLLYTRVKLNILNLFH
jgi:hypothetical protein